MMKDGKCGPQHKPATITIAIDQKKIQVSESVMAGKEIKMLTDRPVDHLLVKVVGEPDPVAGGDDKIICDDEKVDLEDGTRFRIVNPATFG